LYETRASISFALALTIGLGGLALAGCQRNVEKQSGSQSENGSLTKTSGERADKAQIDRATTAGAPTAAGITGGDTATTTTGAALPAGESAATTRGKGAATTAGEGAATARGEGAATARGQGAATARGEGAATARGEGAATARGEGAATTAGEGAAPGVNTESSAGGSGEPSVAASGISGGNTASGNAADTQAVISISDKAVAHLELHTEVIKERELVMPLFLVGHVEAANGGEVDVSTRVAGRITNIAVKPGQSVKKGDLLAMIESREVAELEGEMLEAKSKLEISTAHAERERQVYEEQVARPKALLDARARLAHDKVKMELAQSEFHRVESLFKEKIAAGKDYVSAKATLAEAKLEVDQAQTALLREEHLFKDQILKKDYQVALAEVTREKQHLNTIIKRLEFIGADKKLTSDVLKSGTMNGLSRVTAPVEGVVNHYDFATGEMVHPDDSVFKLTNLRTVQIAADLPEADLQRVKIGDRVKIKVTSYPRDLYEGTISFISQHVNLQTHNLLIRARLENPNGKLRPNMYAEIDVATTSSRALACPKAAVQNRGRHKIVFVKKPGGYEERVIKLEPTKSQYAEVLEGLRSGEEVVTEGSQILKTMQ
jgi:cobalt-zinc-cadmium efflux system membrane fusion protein